MKKWFTRVNYQNVQPILDNVSSFGFLFSILLTNSVPNDTNPLHLVVFCIRLKEDEDLGETLEDVTLKL
jgi:hypothetical protein